MWKWLIGPVLLGSGCLAGKVYARDAEQIVHKSPAETYAALVGMLDNVRQSGTTYFDGGTPMPYEIKVDRTADEKLLVTLSFDGKQGAEADLDLTPQNGGKDTLISAKIHGNHDVLKSALAGTSKARLAYAPDWMLNLAARPTLQQLATQIEQGGTAQIESLSQGEAEAQLEQNMSEEQRQELQDWRQYDATRAASDPNAAAATYMNSAQ